MTIETFEKKQQRIQEHTKYMEEKATTFLRPLMIDILRDKPGDVLEFIIQWCQGKGQSIKAEVRNHLNKRRSSNASIKSHSDQIPEVDLPSSDEDEGDIEDEHERNEKLKRKKENDKKKMAISAEAYGIFNKPKPFETPFIQKSEDQIAKIRATLGMSFMFKNLEKKDFETVINAMHIKNFSDGEFVIQQGADGAELFIVGEGMLRCEKLFPGKQTPSYLETYQVGDVFGELSLMYNAPRAASIISVGKSKCFSLDRDTFNFIVKGAAIKRRNAYDIFLSKIDILTDLEPYEKIKICDCLVTETFKRRDYVIHEGEVGDKFYFLWEGTAEALKLENGSLNKVFEYTSPSYFGELALLNNEKRKASIRITSDKAVLASLDRQSFKRMLGPIENILKRNAEKYAKYMGA